MAAKSRKKSFWGLEGGPLLNRYIKAEAKAGRTAAVSVEIEKAKGAKQGLRIFDTGDEAADDVHVKVYPLATEDLEKDPALRAPVGVRVRDAMGPLVAALEKLDITTVDINIQGPADLTQAVVVGLEVALYRFRRVIRREAPKYRIILRHKGKPVPAKVLAEGIALGEAINLARHLTNLPPNLLNPKTYAEFVSAYSAGSKGLKVEVWDVKRLKKEKCNLHVGVGRGSNRQPRLVRLRYTGSAKKPVVALVGKGITFDTGGLDIKPSSGMRLMKKDMGGSAAVLATVLWAVRTRAKINLDAYLALAENSISGKSFRPSDVIRGRNGMTVEIHNTDAEGRLVLADALDVATGGKTAAKPKCVVDVATLTGAIKVALGAGIAGLFGNDRKLISALHKAGQVSGDPNWPMPLMQKYRSQLNSNFADMINSADGFGGAITAALFLEKFVGDVPWAHLDIYAWKDSADGAWVESGGSGQAVSCLTAWLSELA